VSCNTTFAQIGLDLGAERLIEIAEAFGMNQRIVATDHIPSPLDSRMPTELDPPQTAQSAIGQFDVRTTPLQMALIAATIGNDGVLLRPHLIQSIEDERSAVLVDYAPEPFTPTGRSDAQVISVQTATTLREMMVGVVANGTGGRAAIPGVTVAGKTGTAETGAAPTVWFVGFAPAEDPQVAVAVVIEEGGGVGDEATGGALAAPVARAVMEAALAAGPVR
jgi:peptidoglycan glycosyltransferase